MTEDRFLSRTMAAAYLGLSPATLANWASESKGPAFRIGYDRRARYRLSDLVAFVESGAVRGGVA